jgi:hypothetical protein
VNFTREPIIETVITPRDGHKLILRSSRGGSTEEYAVEAVEVVSFGRSFFFRSVESSKPFLLPVTDYEVLESKEARVALKTVQNDRQIKIGGGREPSSRPHPQPQPQEPAMPSDNGSRMDQPSSEHGSSQHDRGGNKRGLRRRGRRGRGGPDRGSMNGNGGPDRSLTAHDREQQEFHEQLQQNGGLGVPDEEPARASVSSPSDEPRAPSFISKLFPPPPTLIKETLSRYKISEEGEIFTDPNAGKKEPREDAPFDHPISSDPEDDTEV